MPVYSLKSKETVDGAYGWERSQIIKEYLKKLHKEESFTIANQIISIEFQAMESTYKANYDGFCYVRFKEGNQTIMFVELDRLKAEYTVMYPPKKPPTLYIVVDLVNNLVKSLWKNNLETVVYPLRNSEGWLWGKHRRPSVCCD